MEKHLSSKKKTRQKRILSLGLGQSNFLIQLYSELERRDNSLSFSIDSVMEIGENTNSNSFFENIYNFSPYQVSRSNRRRYCIPLLLSLTFWQLCLFERSLDPSSFRFIPFYLRQLNTYALVRKHILPLKFDIHHFHYCTKEHLKYLVYFPKKSNTICSFWGSDLYRNNSRKNNFYVEKALKNASKITIQTSEMADFLLQKHGDSLSHKIIIAQFVLDLNVFKSIDTYRDKIELLYDFKDQLGIEKGHIVLGVGYNANKAFNHIEILKQVHKLDKTLKQKITCVLSLTYGRKEPYLKTLKEEISKYDFNIVCLHDYLDSQAISKLRLITDIQIQLPVSDALSSSVTEVLYAGNNVIAGSWLPYEIYERNNIELSSVDSVEELSDTLASLILTINNNLMDINKRKKKIEKVFFPEKTSRQWLDMYHSLFKRNIF